MIATSVGAGSGREALDGVEVVAVPAHTGPDGPRLAVEARRLRALLDLEPALEPGWCDRHGFTGKVGQVVSWPAAATGAGSAGPLPELLLVGVGEPDGLRGDPGLEVVRRAVAAVVRANDHAGSVAVLLPDGPESPSGSGRPSAEAVGQAAAEGGLLAAYRFDAYRSNDPPSHLARLVVEAGEAESPAVAEGVRRGARVAESVALARDLVNEPPSSLTPGRFADLVADRLAGVPGVSVEVWDEDRIAAERLGGLLGVARGSVQPPRLLRAEYRPAASEDGPRPAAHLALVGKGITFDSGGLSLKTASGMETMKTDMGGAAAVMAALDAAAALGAPVRVTAIAPLTENMPSGSATKPGDVLTTRSGTTIEVLNTDAEGRLILADALCYAVKQELSAVIDLATLTGAVVIALGSKVAGAMGNDRALMRQIMAAAGKADEHFCELPLHPDYRDNIKSSIADLQNIGKVRGEAGSIIGGLFLEEFVGQTPWAHLDIAGTAWADRSEAYCPAGGTGSPVRTLLEYLAAL